MYVVRETAPANTPIRTTLVSQEIGEVVRHMEVEGYEFVMDVMGTKVFTRPDGATASIAVEDVTAGVA